MKIALKFLIIFAFLIANIQVNAQRKPKTGDTKPMPPAMLKKASDPKATVDDENRIWKVVEQPPVFPGAEGAMIAYIKKNLKVPEEVIAARASGKVFVSFVINTDGSISDVKALRDNVGHGMKEAAIKVVQDMPKWTPGRQDGKKVRVQWVLPFATDYSNMK